MTLTVEIRGEPQERIYSGPFFAIRIGTAPGNDIILSDTSAGVQRHHCTIVFSGSTYRLEMPPTHLVFVDGERGECGQQLFRNDLRKCSLSIGGAPAGGRQGARRLAAPPEIVLHRSSAEAEVRPQRRDLRGPRTNFELSVFARVSVRNLVIAVSVLTISGAGFAGYSVWQDRRIEARLADLAKLSAPMPDPSTVNRSLSAVFQIGLAREGRFVPSGTAWAWETPDGEKRLVTNIHVLDSLEACAQATSSEAKEKCAGVDGGCPALRSYQGGSEIITRIALCEPDKPDTRRLNAARHPHHREFELWVQKGGAGADYPNIYDIGVIEWPSGFVFEGEPLRLAGGFEQDEELLAPGTGVAILGFPSEGGGRTDAQAGEALSRFGWVGRVSDPFGLPSSEEDYVVVTGPEVVGGESGSPVINADGEVVAMTFAGFFAARQSDAPLAPRIAYGGRMKALSLRLLPEVAVPGAEPASAGVSEARLRAWTQGLNRMARDYRAVLLEEFRANACQDSGGAGGAAGEERTETLSVRTDREEAFRLGAGQSLSGWAQARDLTVSGGASERVTALILVESASLSPARVLMSFRLGENGARLASQDPSATVASAKVSAAFTEQSPSRRLSYVVFSPGETGRNAEFTVNIHTISCRPGSGA